MISEALGKSGGSGTSVGLGTMGATAAADLSCVMSSLVSFSSVSTFWLATASSVLLLSLGRTGNGVFARRLASVLPPPSRWCCARISALVGLVLDLALTSATSSGGPLRSNTERSNGLNLSASTTACRTIEAASVAASRRSDTPTSAPMNGSDIVRGSATRAARAAGSEAALRGATTRSMAPDRLRAVLAGI